VPISDFGVRSRLAPLLIDVWLQDYQRVTPDFDAVETSSDGFSYLFDIQAERLIAASSIRDRSRSLSAGRLPIPDRCISPIGLIPMQSINGRRPCSRDCWSEACCPN
jgi:hypothetical protein